MKEDTETGRHGDAAKSPLPVTVAASPHPRVPVSFFIRHPSSFILINKWQRYQL